MVRLLSTAGATAAIYNKEGTPSSLRPKRQNGRGTEIPLPSTLQRTCPGRAFSPSVYGCIHLVVVLDGMQDALTGDFCVLELLDEHGLVLERLVLLEEVLQLGLEMR